VQKRAFLLDLLTKSFRDIAFSVLVNFLASKMFRVTVWHDSKRK